MCRFYQKAQGGALPDIVPLMSLFQRPATPLVITETKKYAMRFWAKAPNQKHFGWNEMIERMYKS